MRATASLLGVLAACAGVPPSEGPPITAWTSIYPEVVDPTRETEGPRALFKARAWTPEQGAELDRAVAIYTTGDDEEFAAIRDRLAQDPVTAYWLTRTLVWFVIEAREAAPVDPVALVGEPVWARPIRHIEALGPAAVPAIVLDLLRNRRTDLVALGRELLEVIGPAGLPRWSKVLEIDDPKARRHATEALAQWEAQDPEILALLEKAARDQDFGVRGAAWVGLAKDPEHIDAAIETLATDPDPFVRRELALALGRHRTRRAGNALVDYMERCIADGDERGMLAADAALRKMSGKTERALPATWRNWVSTLRDA